MDLSTLDGLLKTHITHLQDLYGQLGASKDVVPSKLQELHASLVGTVQQQRQSAEEEVKAVQDRIASLTTSIAHKRAQLSGGASTSVTSTPAVTSDKSETLLQEQERLEREEVTLERDVQMRVKQIAQIAKDVKSYRTLLGSDFLESIDIHDQASWVDTDLSLSKVSFLQERLAQCKAEMVSPQRLSERDCQNRFVDTW